jgi:hypothetical protein
MKLTKSKLKQVIKEELQNVLQEQKKNPLRGKFSKNFSRDQERMRKVINNLRWKAKKIDEKTWRKARRALYRGVPWAKQTLRSAGYTGPEAQSQGEAEKAQAQKAQAATTAADTSPKADVSVTHNWQQQLKLASKFFNAKKWKEAERQLRVLYKMPDLPKNEKVRIWQYIKAAQSGVKQGATTQQDTKGLKPAPEFIGTTPTSKYTDEQLKKRGLYRVKSK